LSVEYPDLKKLRILHYPDGHLRDHAAQLKEINTFLQEMTERMAELMRESKGVGLAATQVGWPFRFVIMSPTPDDVVSDQAQGSTQRPATRGGPEWPQTSGKVRTFINPVIVSKRGKLFEEEGCLSVPGVFARIRRAEIVVVRATLPNGEPFETEATGLLARAWQHEIDHLEGTLFVDRINPAARIVVQPKLQEMEKEYEAERSARRRR
jgi:peptide deformylase